MTEKDVRLNDSHTICTVNMGKIILFLLSQVTASHSRGCFERLLRLFLPRHFRPKMDENVEAKTKANHCPTHANTLSEAEVLDDSLAPIEDDLSLFVTDEDTLKSSLTMLSDVLVLLVMLFMI